MNKGHLKSSKDHYSQVPPEPNGKSNGIIIKGGYEIKSNRKLLLSKRKMYDELH